MIRLRSSLNRSLTLMVVVSLLLSAIAPIAKAQDNAPDAPKSNLYLPLISSRQPIAENDLLFRTRVTVNTSAQWHDLERLQVVVLSKGEDWAQLLVDDEQLETLARWRYSPQVTDSLASLLNANANLDGSFGELMNSAPVAQLQRLLAAAQASTETSTTAQSELESVRAAVRAGLQALSSAALTSLAASVTPDADGDGLSDTQEGFWCTDPAKADSDFDGTNDGTEVASLKAWLNNQRAQYPSTGKPFQGWPIQKQNCFDDDQDSVPDIAESLELGLNPNRESTDRDKFDDGQELFGQTYCTGQGGYCSYGPLPRNEDWGVIFAEMPSWVKAPGNHPLVAAFPVPEIDVVESSLKVHLVTTISDGYTTLSGIEKSYSTAKTEGTSTSVANTETWNDWQEIAVAVPSQIRVAEVRLVMSDGTWWKFTGRSMEFTGGIGAGAALGFCLVPGIGWGTCLGAAVVMGTVGITGIAMDMLGEKLDTQSNETLTDNTQLTPTCNTQLQSCINQSAIHPPSPQEVVDLRSSTSSTQDQTTNPGIYYQKDEQSNLTGQPVHSFYYPVSAKPVPITTTSHGKSVGGSQTTTHAHYEEHTITNGEAFLNEESWNKATAINSAHTADLTFSYKVRNVGTEYAREIRHLAFNIYVGDDPNPACTYYFGTGQCGVKASDTVQFANFMPGEEKSFTSASIPLTLEQLKAIDLGGPIRIVVEDFTYGIDELFYQDAVNAGVMTALEDGIADSDESIDTYLIPTWDAGETVLTVLSRYFPHETDSNGTLIAIWTPEYRSDTPSWCQAPRRPTDYPNRVVWCKHALSTADWWNVYTDGLGNGSEGFQTTPAAPGSTALFRFNQDSDLDGFSDRSERQMGTDPYDASSFPKPELLAGLHNLRTGNQVTSTLSLLNTGIYDAYGVEAVMIAPNDTISITNNTVGGSGRVRAQKQVIVGSRIQLPALTNTPWVQANHAQPAVGGYYTGSEDRTYTFTVSCALSGGCSVGSDSWSLFWIDSKGISGTLPFGSGYQSPNFQNVGNLGVTLALYSGKVNSGESFVVAATTPRDTFQYTINREPYTPPLVIVSYNDPQGNHRFMLPTAAMSLTAPTYNLQVLAGSMLQNAGVEIVTTQPFTPGINNGVQLLVNNPSDKTLSNAHLFLEFINISGTVVAEIPTQVTLPPGPTYTPVSFNSGLFDPPYNPNEDYIVMAFLTDYQGNILDTAGRPLSSFQVDPLPVLTVADGSLTWNFGTATYGTLLKQTVALANTGYGRLATYLSPTPGLTLNQTSNQSIGAADTPTYELTLHTEQLPVGAYDQTVLLSTSDPTKPSLPLHVSGMIAAPAPDASSGVMQRPLDVAVTVTGTHTAGEWITFTHTLGPIGSVIHPVKVYSQDYSKMWGVGRYATDFGQGTASAEMFGDGRDGNLTVITGSTVTINLVHTNVNASGMAAIVSSSSGFAIGDLVLLHQTQGTSNVGRWEVATIANISDNTWTFTKQLQYIYSSSLSKAQVIKIPQYRNVTVQSGATLTAPAWDGSTGGIIVFLANESVLVAGTVNAKGADGATAGGSSAALGGLGIGFKGGSTIGQAGQSWQGDGTVGIGTQSYLPNGNAGGGGYAGSGDNLASGGGGGSSANGQNGFAGGAGTSKQVGIGGTTVGSTDLTTMVLGGGGGGSASANSSGSERGGGGAGGGIIILIGKNAIVDTAGAMTVSGGRGGGHWSGGGGGAGGSILLKVQTSTISGTVSANGGWGGGGGGQSRPPSPAGSFGGDGATGRIRIEYCESLTGTTDPIPSTQKLTCYIAEQNSNTTARLNLPEAVNGSKTYNIQFGHKLDFSAAGELTTTLRVPAGLVANSTLDLLISNAGSGNLTLKLDIGNDGSWEWESTQNVTNAATFSSPDLSTAFNRYWSGHGAPTTGNVDIPVRLSLSKAATALLTNLQQLNVTAAATPTAAASAKPLDVSVTITGSHIAGEWVQFTHNLGPNPQSLQPVKVYNDTTTTLWGVGRYATNFGQGTASADMFGDGRDGVMPGSGNLDNNNGFGVGIVNSGSAGSAFITVADIYGISRIKPGDVVLIHQTQGSGAGCWELNKAISQFAGGTATYQLVSPLKCNYVSSGNNHAQIMRVPQYSTCNVTGTVTPLSAWNGSWGGIFAVMCNATISISGQIDARGFGFRGGSGGTKSNERVLGWNGESYSAPSWQADNGSWNSETPPNGGGGGGGHGQTGGGQGGGGGGGGYGSSGIPFVSNQGFFAGESGSAYGTADLGELHLGSGGGGGGAAPGNPGAQGGAGGRGGGAVVIYSKQLSVGGSINTNGQNGGNATHIPTYEEGSGGGGSGGSIRIVASQATINNISSVGGSYGQSSQNGDAYQEWGGSGGVGRIRVEYCETFSGGTNPAASIQKLNCYIAEQLESSPYTTARLNLPETLSNGRTYTVQFGRMITYTAAGSKVTSLRVPAGLYSNVQLNALLSGLTANATLSLDVGNNGSLDWSTTAANNSTNPSLGLADAFTAYWRSQNAPLTGTLDVPIAVALNQPGQVLLTNLWVQTTANKVRYIRLPVQNYNQVKLDFTIGGSGSTNLTVAADVGDNGSIDWSESIISATLPYRFVQRDLTAAFNSYLSGKSGEVDVPIRFYVSPDQSVTLNDFTAQATRLTDLTASQLNGGVQVQASAVSTLTVTEGTVVKLQATIRNNGNQASGPVSAAFFANAAGWGDWYVGSRFIPSLAAAADTPVEVDWDTTGFSGTTPVKVVVNPYRRVSESNYANNAITMTVVVEPPPLPPVADFTATPISGTAPLTVQFTDTTTSTLAISSRLWNFGDGTTSNVQNPTHVYTNAGSYTVTLTAGASNGSDSKLRSSYILVSQPIPPPVVDFSAMPTSGTAPLLVQFSDHSSGPINSWQWNFGDGSLSTTQHPTHTYSASGLYTVTLTVSGAGGSQSKTSVALINVAAIPTPISATLSLLPGWNLVSLPLQPNDPAVTSLFSPISGHYDLVYAYRQCDTADPWKKYDTQAPSFLNDLVTVDPGMGLWVRMNTTDTLRIVGILPVSSTIDLCSGWNLVGYPSQTSRPLPDGLASINGCYSYVYAYDTASQSWPKYDAARPFLSTLSSMNSQRGYWIKAEQACTWVVNNGQ
ncbi:MAG: PKD domain-containing protein [Caldilineaceae bacterium]